VAGGEKVGGIDERKALLRLAGGCAAWLGLVVKSRRGECYKSRGYRGRSRQKWRAHRLAFLCQSVSWANATDMRVQGREVHMSVVTAV
jgi:hypothetical protein